MSRYIKYFFIGLAVLLVVEIGAMIYINDVYLADNSNYSEVKIDNSSATAVKYKDVAVNSLAQQFSSSHDGQYVAYMLGGSVSVTDLVSGRTSVIAKVPGMSVKNFKWLYDRDWMAVAEASSSSSGSTYVKLYSYDASQKKITEIRNSGNDQELKIRLASKTNVVSQLEMSTETGLNYIKVTNTKGMSTLWKINSYVGVTLMSNIRTSNIGGILSLKITDALLYEDNDNGRVYQYGNST
jgi:hypothetical protein